MQPQTDWTGIISYIAIMIVACWAIFIGMLLLEVVMVVN